MKSNTDQADNKSTSTSTSTQTRTHTIRWNKSRKLRIVSFTQYTLDRLSVSHLDSVRLVIAGLLNRLNDIDEGRHVLSMEDSEKLKHVYDTTASLPDYTPEAYALRQMVMQGYSYSYVLKDLDTLDPFFNWIDTQVRGKPASVCYHGSQNLGYMQWFVKNEQMEKEGRVATKCKNCGEYYF